MVPKKIKIIMLLKLLGSTPEIGSIWRINTMYLFDESRYIKDGIYSINNMKRIIAEVNWHL